MALFSSTQPSLRARILPRFPANVIAGNGMVITKSGSTYTFAANNAIDPGSTEGRVPFDFNGTFDSSAGLIYNNGTNTLETGAVTATGNITAGGIMEAGVTVKTTPTTVALLPAASSGTAGRRAFVTDANATTFASIVAGGGANGVPVFDDGTNWRIG